jgi:Family of unknown function (DUF6152)
VNPIRKNSKIVAAGIAVLMILTAVPVFAHHAFASEFDANKPVKFRGTVTKMEWINPHAWIHVSVKKPNGTVEQWMIEAGTPNTLLRRGFTKQSLLPGTEVVVDGYQSKDGSLRANGRDITLPNGQTLFLGNAVPDAPYQEKPAQEKSK